MDSNSKNNEAEKAEQKMLGAIREGKVTMRPKWQFALKTALFVVGAAIALLAILYLASFIIFVLRETGVWFTPAFGVAGWFSFFHSLPWLLVLLLVVFVAILAILVKRYAFVYERPLLYLFVGMVILVAGGGFLVAETTFHRSLFNSARHNQLPMLGGFYRGFGMQRFGDVHRGTVISTTTNSFMIQDDGGQTSTIVLGSHMRFPGSALSIGSSVVVFGIRTPSGTIIAEDIQPVAP